MDFLDFPDTSQEVGGAMISGRFKMTNQGLIFKSQKTGKMQQISPSEIDTVHWQRLGGSFGLRIFTTSGMLHRFANFREADFEKLGKFFSHHYNKTLEEKELSIKGWNWGVAKFQGSVLSFDVDNKTAFEISLPSVSQCTSAKNEVTLEFHQLDEAAVSLVEMRFHIPSDNAETDTVKAFVNNVQSKANIIQATGDAIVTFKEVHCLTPRGRYDIKLYPSFIQLHGKTFDFKITLNSVLRLFLLPHKDQRQMFFVLSLDPPIKQGQTRYHFVILLFNNEEESTVDVAISDSDLETKYAGKLEKEMTGPTYELMSKVMKALVNKKITVPGNFTGNTGTAAISCSYKAAAGLMYPLERGFIYVHKPPIHLRFEEIDSVNFARSGGSTRSFDFEVEVRSGVVHTFSSIEKEEYGKLYDFISSKKLRVKNRGQLKQGGYKDDDIVNSDEEGEPDAYLARVKAEAAENDDDDDGGDSDESTDEDFNPDKAGSGGSDVAEEFDTDASYSTTDDEAGEDGKKRKKEGGKPKSKRAKTIAEPGTRKERKKKNNKGEKDENKPKRPQSAFFLFMNEMREKIKKDNPGIPVNEVAKKGGEMWKEAKDKTKWEKLAEQEKEKYNEAMAAYKASGGGEGSSKSPKKKSKSSPKKSSAAAASSPSKGGFKSKEYISSSEGSSSGSDDEDDKKKSKKKPKKPAKKEDSGKGKKKKESSDEDEKESDKESEKEEEKAASSAASSAAESEAESSGGGSDSD